MVKYIVGVTAIHIISYENSGPLPQLCPFSTGSPEISTNRLPNFNRFQEKPKRTDNRYAEPNGEEVEREKNLFR